MARGSKQGGLGSARFVGAALLMVGGCQGDPVKPGAPASGFPEDFLWGTATAGFQVDMGCPTWSAEVCDDPNSDWYQWVTTEAIVEESSLHVTGEPVSAGPGMWELFEDDVALMAADGMGSYRMSLEWSRLFPDGAAEGATSVEALAALADPDATARYHEMFAALAEANITPLVTVNHYTLPLWVHDGVACHEDLETCEANGWVDGARIQRLISLYAGWVAMEFGGEVDRWATLNEPFATTLSGYLAPGEDRSAPPGLFLSADAVVASLTHQIEAHAMMADNIRAYDADGEAEVGVVLNMVAILPENPDSPEDVAVVAHMDHLYHRLFLDGLTAGSWDDDLDGQFDRTRPELAGRLDWIGINYYNQVTVRAWVPLLAQIPVFDFYPTFSWDPYPAGIADVVGIAAGYDLPIYVTENGTPHTDLADTVLEEHLTSLEGAVAAGADVRGYYYWSFIDNYEWNHGLDLRFGLYELDGVTKERRPRAVRDRYREIITNNGP